MSCITQSCHKQGACPFAFNDLSEQAQNYGCLPTPYQIIQMRQEHGKTWACHSDTTKPCLGAIKYMKEKGMEYKVIDNNLVDETSEWGLFCKPSADQI